MMINSRPSDTPLHRCARVGTKSIMMKLIDAGGNANLCDANDRPVLMEALKHANIEVSQALLDLVQDWDQKDNEGLTYLMAACYANVDLVASVLGKSKTNVNALDNQRRSALSHACSVATVDTVKLLIENGANINLLARYNHSLLHFAVITNRDRTEEQHLELVKYLLNIPEIHRFINAADTVGRTAITVALLEGPFSVVQYLFSQGATIEPEALLPVTKTVASLESYKLIFQQPQMEWTRSNDPKARSVMEQALIHVTAQRRLVFAKFLGGLLHCVFVDSDESSRPFFERLLSSLATSSTSMHTVFLAEKCQAEADDEDDDSLEEIEGLPEPLGESLLWLLDYNPTDEATKCRFNNIVVSTKIPCLQSLPDQFQRALEAKLAKNFMITSITGQFNNFSSPSTP